MRRLAAFHAHIALKIGRNLMCSGIQPMSRRPTVGRSSFPHVRKYKGF
jgi:hypothetical protein